MESEFLFYQISQLVSSVIDIAEALSTESKATFMKNTDVLSLIEARAGIIESLITLNIIISGSVETVDPETTIEPPNQLFPGSLILAPRYFSKQIQPDLGIVLSSTVSDVSIAWLRPLSSYELLASATAIRYSRSQVMLGGTAMLCQQSQSSAKLQLGDRVLCRSSGDMGIWKQGLVSGIDHAGTSLVVVKIFSSDGSSRIESIPWQINSIAPFPGNSDGADRGDAIRPLLSSSSDGRLHTTHATGIVSVSSFNYAKRYSDSYEDLNRYSNKLQALGDDVLSDLSKFGTWEKYTKGVGTRVLQRMGYRRGRGLGVMEQGVFSPVKGLLKALPSGLSLDYIAQEKIKQTVIEDNKVKEKVKPKVEVKQNVFDFMNTLSHRPAPISQPSSTIAKSKVSMMKAKLSQGSGKNIF